jgi:murein L,D-transpeptidase YafK
MDGLAHLSRTMLAIAGAALLASCADEAPKHMQPLSYAMQAELKVRALKAEAPIMLRIIKADSELEVWKRGQAGRFVLLKTYPICKWSGDLGPKVKEGDKQAPEGFYSVRPVQMNPWSKYYLSFNMGYPNRYDQAHERTGAHLMIHGDCSSAGCYSMTDDIIADLYALAREAFDGGQPEFQIQAFPFRMSDEEMEARKDSKWYDFWLNLKEGYDAFERDGVPPMINVCGGKYVFNATFAVPDDKIDPQADCPPRIEDQATSSIVSPAEGATD